MNSYIWLAQINTYLCKVIIKQIEIMETEKLYQRIKEQLENKYMSYGCKGVLETLNLNGFSWAIVRDKTSLEIAFEEAEYKVTYTDVDGTIDIESNMHSGTHKGGVYILVNIGFTTKSGYISTKKLPVNFDYSNEKELTENQAFELLKYETDAKKNTFDPFYAENEYKRRNAAAWNYIAKNYITDPYCTR